jgi:hypothetical protein
MKLLVAIGMIVVVLTLFSCNCPHTADKKQIYFAWENGLTLVFEDLDILSMNDCNKKRRVVRVETVTETPSGLIVNHHVTSPTKAIHTMIINKNCGVRMLSTISDEHFLLPDGFPGDAAEWKSYGSFHRIIGRAVVRLPGIDSTDHLSVTGIWVETVSLCQPKSRARTLYLPNIGEVETMIWNQSNHHWITTRRLVSVGFTDISVLPSKLSKVS